MDVLGSTPNVDSPPKRVWLPVSSSPDTLSAVLHRHLIDKRILIYPNGKIRSSGYDVAGGVGAASCVWWLIGALAVKPFLYKRWRGRGYVRFLFHTSYSGWRELGYRMGDGGVDGNGDGDQELLLDNEILMGFLGNVQGRERLRCHCLRSEIGVAGAHRVQ